MAYIDNSETARELDEAIRGNAQTNLAPKQIAGQVVPVIDVNPKSLRRVNRVISGTVAGTIGTTSANKKTFLVGATLSGSGTATATPRISAFLEGQTTAVDLVGIDIRVSALIDVANSSQSFMLPFPALLAKNTAIALTGAATSTRASVYLIEVDEV